MTEGGQFVGFNRQTGAPEFVSEAPSAGGSEKFQGVSGSPPLGHPAFPHHSQNGAYELPADLAPVAEMGPPK
jgi:hypothetical protein